jgi:hypothetical protein
MAAAACEVLVGNHPTPPLLCTHTCMHVCCAGVCLCFFYFVYVCMYVCMYIFVCMCVFIHTYIQKYTYMQCMYFYLEMRCVQRHHQTFEECRHEWHARRSVRTAFACLDRYQPLFKLQITYIHTYIHTSAPCVTP